MVGSSSKNVTCDLFGGHQELCDIVIIAKRISASISCLGCLLMLLNIFAYKKHTNFIQRIIIYMTVAALLSAVAYVIGDLHEDGPLCTFQGFTTNLADWSVLMWMFMITVTLHLRVFRDIRLDNKEWMFHVLCWGVPLVASCIPFIGGHYGPAGAWCWVDDTAWRFGIWYIPLFTLLFVMVVLNLHLIFEVRRRARSADGIFSPETEHTKQVILEEVKALRAYPFVYLAINIFPLINRIQNAATTTGPIFVLTLLHAVSVPSQGAFNASVFGLNKEILNEFRWPNLKGALRNMCRKRSEIGEYEVQEDDDHPIVGVGGSSDLHTD